jgi:ABC-type multidrug transport system fused ATPase/permease subunit
MIPKGKTTALVGPSGSGKSTVAALILRQYDVAPHTLVFDGKNIRDFDIPSLRRQIAVISQDILLLDGTLRDNLTFGAAGHPASAAIQSASAGACLDAWIESLPQGLDTRIGPNGVTVSGGQRQRIAIARAILQDRPILILDEATSALDSETEQRVQLAIERLTQHRTCLVIAHRMATIQRADSVVVLEDGRVVETGSCQELLARRGRFHALWEAQKFDRSSDMPSNAEPVPTADPAGT